MGCFCAFTPLRSLSVEVCDRERTAGTIGTHGVSVSSEHVKILSRYLLDLGAGKDSLMKEVFD